jgi:hypothetical protein
MASNYPASLDTTTTLPAAAGVGANLSIFPHSALHGNADDAIIAIETELGVAPSGSDTTVVARLDRIAPTLGVATTWAPTVTQSGSVTVTNVRSTWSRLGRVYFMRFQLTVTGSGTGSNAIVIGNFGTSAGSHPTVVGEATVTDASTGFLYTALLTLASTTTMNLTGTSVAGQAPILLGVTGFTAALASGDTLSGSFFFEGNAD